MNSRLVSPAKPSVIHCSRSYPTSTLNLALSRASDDQDAVVFPFLTDTTPVVFEQFVGVLADVTERFDRGHCRDNDNVAGRRLQCSNHAFDLCGVGPIDHAGKIVDWLRQLGKVRF